MLFVLIVKGWFFVQERGVHFFFFFFLLVANEGSFTRKDASSSQGFFFGEEVAEPWEARLFGNFSPVNLCPYTRGKADFKEKGEESALG